ncbi:cytochrome c-type biogenesis protein [Hydrocarboniphaga sp.]|uniref:cytochrome c-type biogenesis protein n=1 Tax=Hydrocarboniphaga sp. TaxID=2033016 RepID=UPI00260FDA05|nr:cytochrome c-type biogenesis protein [Hydrocarboniphaga sp.]
MSLAVSVSFAAAIDPLPPLSGAQQEHYQQLISQLRCLVCQNQTIADSTAPLALDLREQVHRQIAEGRSDAQIRQYMTDRYGDFVLYKPQLKPRTILLWFGPFVLLALALITAVIFTRRSRRRPVPVAVDQQALQRLLSEEDGR